MAPFLLFWSRGTDAVKIFSNFYGMSLRVEWPSSDDIPLFMRGLERTYPSSEHAYQALKCMDLASADEFTSSGLFGSFAIFEKWPTSKKGDKFADLRAKKEKAWGKCPGIIAKMVSKLDSKTICKVWGVSFAQRRLSTVWSPILAAKFRAGSALGNALLKTMPLDLIEFDRGSTRAKPSFWGASVNKDDGKVVGANAMGELLMCQRSTLHAEKK